MNSLTYEAGDSILFHGGDSFTGCVMINPTRVPNKGSASNPITLDSYGSGNATLLSNCPGNLHALLTIDGVSGVTVQNLILSANGTQTAYGVLVQNSYSTTAPVDTIVIQNTDISGFHCCGTSPGQYGSEIFIAGQAYATGGNCGPLNNIQVLNNKLHGAAGPTSPDDNGITGSGCGGQYNVTNVKYSGNEVWNIGGHSGSTVSGNGIVANRVANGELSFNIVHDLGGNNRGCPGPVGIWAWQSDNIAIRFNEVYRMQQLTPPAVMGCDWAAYDFDEGVTNSVYEYNYSHDNGGAAILVYNPGGGNVFRYNVSENDDNQMLGGSGVYAIGIPGGSLSIYNNTIYRSGVFSRATPSCYTFGAPPSAVYPTGIVLANNLCIIAASSTAEGFARYIDVNNGTDIRNVTIKNNLYYSPSAVWWINARYDTLAQVQAAGWEQGSIVAASSPAVNAGSGGTCNWSPRLANGPQPCPSAYQLVTGAPGIGAGLNLTQPPHNFNVGTRDYWGTAMPHTLGSGYNMGADGARH
jgi:hypothetical protein